LPGVFLVFVAWVFIATSATALSTARRLPGKTGAVDALLFLLLSLVRARKAHLCVDRQVSG